MRSTPGDGLAFRLAERAGQHRGKSGQFAAFAVAAAKILLAECGSAQGRSPAIRTRQLADMATVLVLNGPNLNLLGIREPGHYGQATLAQIEARLVQRMAGTGHHLRFIQSNAEHVLIDAIHGAPGDGVAFILFNPAAFTHTSVALRDALLAVSIPFIEVHLSNVHAREPFRAHSYFSDIAVGVISGLGALGYELALAAALDRLA